VSVSKIRIGQFGAAVADHGADAIGAIVIGRHHQITESRSMPSRANTQSINHDSSSLRSSRRVKPLSFASATMASLVETDGYDQAVDLDLQGLKVPVEGDRAGLVRGESDDELEDLPGHDAVTHMTLRTIEGYAGARAHTLHR
jgi:hypothetical protein